MDKKYIILIGGLSVACLCLCIACGLIGLLFYSSETSSSNNDNQSNSNRDINNDFTYDPVVTGDGDFEDYAKFLDIEDKNYPSLNYTNYQAFESGAVIKIQFPLFPVPYSRVYNDKAKGLEYYTEEYSLGVFHISDLDDASVYCEDITDLNVLENQSDSDLSLEESFELEDGSQVITVKTQDGYIFTRACIKEDSDTVWLLDWDIKENKFDDYKDIYKDVLNSFEFGYKD